MVALPSDIHKSLRDQPVLAGANDDFIDRRIVSIGARLPSNIRAIEAPAMNAETLLRMLRLAKGDVKVVNCTVEKPSRAFTDYIEAHRNNRFIIKSSREVEFWRPLTLHSLFVLKARGEREFFRATVANANLIEAFEAHAFTKRLPPELMTDWRRSVLSAAEAITALFPDAYANYELDASGFFQRMPKLKHHMHNFSDDMKGEADHAALRHGEWYDGYYLNCNIEDDEAEGTVFLGDDGQDYYTRGLSWNLFRVSQLHSTTVQKATKLDNRMLSLMRFYLTQLPHYGAELDI